VNYCAHLDTSSSTSMGMQIDDAEYIMCATEVEVTCEMLGL